MTHEYHHEIDIKMEIKPRIREKCLHEKIGAVNIMLLKYTRIGNITSLLPDIAYIAAI